MSNCSVLPLDIISSFLFGIPLALAAQNYSYFPIMSPCVLHRTGKADAFDSAVSRRIHWALNKILLGEGDEA
jgi:hypothetical protein